MTYLAFLLITWLALTPPGHWINYAIAIVALAFAFIEAFGKKDGE